MQINKFNPTKKIFFSLFFFLLLLVLTVLLFINKKSTFEELYLLYNNWENVEAEKLAGEIFNDTPDNTEIKKIYGEILFRQGKLNEAKTIFLLLASTDSASVKYSYENKIRALLRLAKIHYYLNNPDTALAILNEADYLASSVNDSISIAASYNIKGLIDFNKLDYSSALKNQQRSLLLARKYNNETIEADALRQIGVLYWYSANYDSALNEYYKPALKIYREINDKSGEATTLSNIGLLYRDMGKSELNINYQLQAFAIRKQINDKIGIADCYYFLSSSVSFDGWHGTLYYSYLRKSYELSEKAGYRWGMEIANRSMIIHFDSFLKTQAPEFLYTDTLLLNTGEGAIYSMWFKINKLRKEGNLDEGVKAMEHLIFYWDSIGYKFGATNKTALLASMLIEKKDYSKAEALLKSYRKSDFNNIYYEFEIDTTYARLYIRKGELLKAKQILIGLCKNFESLYNQQILSNENKELISRVVRNLSGGYSMLIEVLNKTGDSKLLSYIQKERSLSSWLGGTNYYNEFYAGEYPFDDFIDLLDEYEKKPEQFSNITPLVEKFEEAHNKIEQINDVIINLSRESELFSSSSQISFKDELKKLLKEREVLLEYFIGIDNLFVLVTRQDSSTIIELNISRDELNSLVILYNEVIERGAKNPDDNLWMGISHTLYKILIEPVIEKGFIERNDRLIISPHKILHLLPFQTLITDSPGTNNIDETPEFLIERNMISYTTSSTTFLKDNKTRNGNLNSILIVAPDTRSLPGAEKEISGIPQKPFLNYTLLKNKNAQKEKVLHSMKNFDIIHIAAHSKMNQWFPLYSTIECNDKSIKLYEILEEKLNSTLVILSACETGLSVSSSGGTPVNEDILSFSRAFLSNGTASVIASLWIVNDKSTVELMNLFYNNMFNKNIEENISIVNSFNNAQRQFILHKRNEGKSIHPFYWGAFFVFGL